MKWVVTGGCGFIGSSLISKLSKRPENQIRVIDNFSVGTRNDLKQRCEFRELELHNLNEQWANGVTLIKGDILNNEMLARVIPGADCIVHLAANTGVAPSIKDPLLDCKTNVIGTLNILEACREFEVKRFVFASSGAPLGEQVPPLHEEMAPRPASPYGASKLAGEGYCSAYFQSFNVETVALRFGNVYGVGSNHKESLVAKFVKTALAGKTFEVYGDGSQTRDFIYIDDLVAAITRASTTPGIGGEIFQIATANETTVGEITQVLSMILEDEFRITACVEYGQWRVGDVRRNFSDTKKARDKLGWCPEMMLVDGLRETVRYLVSQHEYLK